MCRVRFRASFVPSFVLELIFSGQFRSSEVPPQSSLRGLAENLVYETGVIDPVEGGEKRGLVIFLESFHSLPPCSRSGGPEAEFCGHKFCGHLDLVDWITAGFLYRAGAETPLNFRERF